MAAPAAAPMSDDARVWSLPKRVLFRFGFVAGVLYVYPAPLGYLPGTDTAAEVLGRPWTWLVVWFSESVLGAGTPPLEPTGAGDTLFAWVSFLLVVLGGAVGAAIWSVLDRRRTAYPRLAAGALIALRYLLAYTMLSYGLAKLVGGQFRPPSHLQLDSRFGDGPPMSVLWKFMGSSMAYTYFTGVAEVLAGALLFWRRTSTVGALLAAAIMTQVVVLNLCYDVPVKLYSMQLLAMALVIAGPQLRRVGAALLGAAVPAVAARTRGSTRFERARLAGKLALAAVMTYRLYDQAAAVGQYRLARGPLDGIWSVDTYTADGVERPPLTTDEVRWRKLIIDGRMVSVRWMNGTHRIHQGALDPAAGTLHVTGREADDTWRYTRPDPDHLIVDGTWRGSTIHVTLTREPPPILVTRGFHWIQEFPFNW